MRSDMDCNIWTRKKVKISWEFIKANNLFHKAKGI